MKWAYVSFHICQNRINVPFSFIKDHEKLEISLNKPYFVFWRSPKKETPDDILKKSGRIFCVDKIKRRNQTAPLTYYALCFSFMLLSIRPDYLCCASSFDQYCVLCDYFVFVTSVKG